MHRPQRGRAARELRSLGPGAQVLLSVGAGAPRSPSPDRGRSLMPARTSTASSSGCSTKRARAPPFVRYLAGRLIVGCRRLALAACGGDEGRGGSGTAGGGDRHARRDASGKLTISNWPLYIDKTVLGVREETASASSTSRTSTTTTSSSARSQPLLDAGRVGRARHRRAHRLHARAGCATLGYLQRRRQRQRAEHRNLVAEPPDDPVFDPKRNYSLPWQSGHDRARRTTGPRPAGRDVGRGPLRPEVQGQVEMLSELHDSARLVLLCDGRRATRPPRTRSSPRSTRSEGADRPDPPLHRQRLHERPGEGQPSPRWPTRATSSSSRPTTRTSISSSRGGLNACVGQHDDPGEAPNPTPPRR